MCVKVIQTRVMVAGVFAALALSASILDADDIRWAVDVDGYWNEPSNWNPPRVPEADDDVTIDRPGVAISVTHTQPTPFRDSYIHRLACHEALVVNGFLHIAAEASIDGNLLLDNGILWLNGPSYVTNETTLAQGAIYGIGPVSLRKLVWTGGEIASNGGVTVEEGGTMSISEDVSKSLGNYDYNATAGLTNRGFATLSGNGNIYRSGYVDGSGAVLTNEGTFEIQSDAGFLGGRGTGQRIDNSGMFRKSGGSGASTIEWDFNNSGTVEVQSGTLTISGFFTNSGTVRLCPGIELTMPGWRTTGGTYDVGPDAVLNFTAPHDLSDARFVNAGTINFPSGAQYFTTSTTFPGNVNLNGAGLTFAHDTASRFTGTTVLSAGGISSTGSVAFKNLLWTGGWFATAQGLVIEPDGTLTMQGDNDKVCQGPLVIRGHAFLDGMGNLRHNWYPGSSGVQLVISPTGTFDIQSDAGLAGSAGVQDITNAGLFRKTDGTGTSNIEWVFNNTGRLEVLKGTLNLANLYNAGTVHLGPGIAMTVPGGSTTGGVWELSPDAVLSFGDYHEFRDVTFANGGRIDFSGAGSYFHTATTIPGQVNLNGAGLQFSPGDASHFTGTTVLSAGYLTANAPVTFHKLEWTGGYFGGSGGVIIDRDGMLTISGDTDLLFVGSLSVDGEAVLTGKGNVVVDWTWLRAGVTIRNSKEATFDIREDMGFTAAPGPWPATFDNAGLLKKSNGTGTSTIEWFFNNIGTVEVHCGILKLNSVLQLQGTTLTGGTWEVCKNPEADSATLLLGPGSDIVKNQGNVILDGPNSVFAQIDALADNQGGFSILNGRNFTTQGDLANSGTITAGAGSTLTVNGTLSLSAGTLAGSGTVEGLVAVNSGTVHAPCTNDILTLTGQLSGNGALRKTGMGTVTLLRDSPAFSGPLEVQAGTLLGTASSGTPFGIGPLTVTGATLAVGPADSDAITTLAAACALPTTTFTFGPGTATVSLAKKGTGSTTLTLGHSSPAGSVLVRDGHGVLVIAPANGKGPDNFGDPSGERLLVNGMGASLLLPPHFLGQDNDAHKSGAFLKYHASNGFQAVTGFQSNNDLEVPSASNVFRVDDDTQHLDSAERRTQQRLILNGQTISGDGTLQIGDEAGSAGLILNGGTINAKELAFASNAATIYTSLAGAAISSPITGDAVLGFCGPGQLTLPGTIAHAGTLDAGGSGTLLINGNNQESTFTLVVSSGTVQIGGGSAIPDTSAVTVAGLPGATLDLLGSSETIGRLDGGGLVTNSGSQDSVLTLSTGDFSGTISDGDTHMAALRKVGAEDATLVLGGRNTFTGGTTVETGVLEIASAGALPDGGSLNIGPGATVVLQNSLSVTSADMPFTMRAAAPQAVPEPGTLVLLAVGAAWLAVLRPRRKQSPELCD